jgi:hypothetical protein
MASTYPNCPGSSSYMHRAYPQALGPLALFDHQSASDKVNCGSGGYLERHAAAPRNEQQAGLLNQR